MDRDYFTADLHLGHRSIMKYQARTALMTDADRLDFDKIKSANDQDALRAWKPSRESVERMDDLLITNINTRVPADATLWIVGDFTLSTNEREIREYRERITCRDVRLIWGNHDARHRAGTSFSATYDAVMLYVLSDRTLTQDELLADADLRRASRSSGWMRKARRVYLSHYMHAVWEHSHKSVYHLYGHSHGNVEQWREAHMPNALCMDVGVDCWEYKPIAWSEIDTMLASKRNTHPAHSIDHH